MSGAKIGERQVRDSQGMPPNSKAACRPGEDIEASSPRILWLGRRSPVAGGAPHLAFDSAQAALSSLHGRAGASDLCVIDTEATSPRGAAELIRNCASAGVPVLACHARSAATTAWPGVALHVVEDGTAPAEGRGQGNAADPLRLPPAIDDHFCNPIRGAMRPRRRLVVPAPGGLDRVTARRLAASGLPFRVERRAPNDEAAAPFSRRVKRCRAALLIPALFADTAALARCAHAVRASGVPVVLGPDAPPGLDGTGMAILASWDELEPTCRPLLDNAYRAEAQALKGRRHVLGTHTGRARLATVLGALGWSEPAAPRVSLLAPTIRPGQIDHIFDTVAAQDWPELELVLGLHGSGFDRAQIEARAQALSAPVRVIELPASWWLAECLNAMVNAATGSLVAKLDDDDTYGASHITDLIQAWRYSGADVVGKWYYFVYLEGQDTTILYTHFQGFERRAELVWGGGWLASRELCQDLRFRRCRAGFDTLFFRSVRHHGGSVYFCHPFGVLLHRAAEAAGHTWRAGDALFLARAKDRLEGKPAWIMGDVVSPLPPADRAPPDSLPWRLKRWQRHWRQQLRLWRLYGPRRLNRLTRRRSGFRRPPPYGWLRAVHIGRCPPGFAAISTRPDLRVPRKPAIPPMAPDFLILDPAAPLAAWRLRRLLPGHRAEWTRLCVRWRPHVADSWLREADWILVRPEEVANARRRGARSDRLFCLPSDEANASEAAAALLAAAGIPDPVVQAARTTAQAATRSAEGRS